MDSFDRFGKWFSGHWLEIVCLIISATRTFDIVQGTSPVFYMPFAGVAIMEGAWIFWNNRFVKARNSWQMSFAGTAIVITWIIIGLTIAADAVWIASQRKIFNIGEMPVWASDVAVFSVVLVGMIHIALLGFYIHLDPEAKQKREHEKKVREIQQEEHAVMLERDRQQMEARTRGWKSIISKVGDLEGLAEYREQFYLKYGYYPEDIEAKAKRLLKGGNTMEATAMMAYNQVAPAADKAVEANGGNADRIAAPIVTDDGKTANPTRPRKAG